MLRSLCLIGLLVALTAPDLSAQTLFYEMTPLDNARRQIGSLYFDIEARASDICICGIDLFFGSELEEAKRRLIDLTIHSRPITAIGAESSPGAWTLNHSQTGIGIIAGGPNTLATFELQNSIFIPAGTRRGVAIHAGDPNDTVPGFLLCEVDVNDPPGTEFFVGTDMKLRTGTASFRSFPAFNNPLLFLGNKFTGGFHYVLSGSNCNNAFILPTKVVGPTLSDTPSGGGPFLAGCVTIIQGNALGQATIPPGMTLTAEPGSIVKPMPGVRVAVQGDLNALGSRWTSLNDDSLGGDSNGDGNATSPNPGDWGSIVWSSSATGSIERSSFSYGGGAGPFGPTAPVMDFNSADISVVASMFSNNASIGSYVCDFNGNSVPPEFRNNLIADNQGAAIGNVPCGALDGFQNNATENNQPLNGADGNALHAIGQPSIPCSGGPRDVTTDVKVGPGTYPGDVLVVRGRICIENGGRLTLCPDTKIKFDPSVRSGIEVQSTGTLEIRGTASRAVCITSLPDDDVGGDTNADGPSMGTPGDWEGIKYTGSVFGPGPQGCVENARLSYTGATPGGTPTPGLDVNGSTVELENVTVELGSGDGICIELVALARNLGVYDNIGCGLRAGGNGTTHVVDRVTARGNGGAGITSAPGWAGDLRSTNAWGNVGPNIDTANVNPLQVFNSNGMDPALGDPTAGNMNVDPMFRDADGPDLLPASPLRDQGLVFATYEYDINGGSAVNGPAPDIGAAEVASRCIEVSGRLQQGDFIQIDIIPDIPASPNFLAVSLNPQSTVVPGLGTVAGGLDLNDYLLLGPFVGPTSITLPLPDDPCFSLDGLPVSFQGFGPGFSGGIEMSNAWTGTIAGPPPLSACNGQ